MATQTQLDKMAAAQDKAALYKRKGDRKKAQKWNEEFLRLYAEIFGN